MTDVPATLNSITHINVWYLRDETHTTAAADDSLKTMIAAVNAKSEVTVVGQSNSFVETAWEPTKGDFHTAVHDKVNPYSRFRALVVDATSTPSTGTSSSTTTTTSSSIASIIDGDVMYALFEKGLPVLVLVDEHSKKFFTRTHRLLTTVVVANNEQKEEATKTFFSFPEFAGRVIVVEGGDGAGKQTQVKLLFDRLVTEGYRAETLDYPHDAAGYGVLIRELLSGKMGNIREVNPLIFATIYGLNRHSTLPLLKFWVQKGANIILDRYMTANFGHQASKLSKDEDRIAAINTLRTFELKWLNLPDADKVFYLNLPPDFAFKAMQEDTTRRELDMHELAGIEYKNNVRKSFLWCCETFNETWKEIPCVNGDETARFSREEIHRAIYQNVSPLLVNKNQQKA